MFAGGVGLGFLGLRSYCAGGKNIYRPVMSEKVCIVTGGNSGIGKETCRELAMLDAQIVITGRDGVKAELLRFEITDEFMKIGKKPPRIKFIEVDFSDLRQVKVFAEMVKKEYRQLHVLINNAGATTSELRRAANGLESTMLVNHLAPTYLTHLLLPLLADTPQSRVINVASRAHMRDEKFRSPLKPDFSDYFFDKLTSSDYSRARVYNTSKLANVLFTKGLDKHLREQGLDVKTAALHPGVIRSDFFRDFDSPLMLAYKLLYPLMFAILKTESEGAQTTLHCALMPYKELVSGGYYSDCAIKAPSSEASLEANVAESWRQTIDKLKSLTGEKSIFGQ